MYLTLLFNFVCLLPFYKPCVALHSTAGVVKLMMLEGSKGITHYLGDKNRFDVSSEGPSSGISVGGRGKHACFYISEYIKTTRDKIKTNQMDLIKTRNK